MKPALLIAAAVAWLIYVAEAPGPGELPATELAAILAIGGGLMLVGLVAIARGAPAAAGALPAAAGFTWLIALLRFADDSVAWTVSLVASGIPVALLVHIALAYPGGAASRGARCLIALTYAVMVAGPLAIAAFTRDPASQGYVGFPENLVLIGTGVETWKTLNLAFAVTEAALAVALLGLLAHRFIVVNRAARRSMIPSAVAGVAAAFLLALPMLADGLDARANAVLIAPWDLLRWVVVVVLGSVPIALALGLVDARLRRSSVADLVIDLDRSPGSDTLRGSLVRALRDPSLTLAIWDDDTRQYRDAGGDKVDLPVGDPGRAATVLQHRGRRVGALIHDAALRQDAGLMAAAAAAARMALENERLHRELRVQLAEVRASRARIVEAGDIERRRLERDLHDGAQQKLVSLALAIQLAEHRAASDPELMRLLETAKRLTGDSLADVRAVAHGLHPPILQEEGLDAALEALAMSASIPTELAGVHGRYPAPVEAAVYFVASEALANAGKHSHARSVTIHAQRTGALLRLDITDDGIGGADPTRGTGLRGLSDRIAALDGHLDIDSHAGRGTRLRIEIPLPSDDGSHARQRTAPTQTPP